MNFGLSMRALAVFVSLTMVLSSQAAADFPWADAVAVWPMDAPATSAGANSLLSIVGNVRLGVPLEGAQREASLRRGGKGRVAHFDGGYLRAGIAAARPQTLGGKELTIYLRLQDAGGAWAVPLFSKDDRDDKYGGLLYGANGVLTYQWRTEPLARRARGTSGPTAGYGFNGEGNDQHHLASYQAGQFAVSTLTLDESGLVNLWHNGRHSSGTIDPQKQNVGREIFRIGAKHDGDERLEGEIAEILIYDRVIADSQRKSIENALKSKWGFAQASAAAANEPFPAQGLVLHLDAGNPAADCSSPKAGPLAVWKDTSGAGQNVAQNVREQQPALVPGALAGKAVVRFEGHQWLDGPAVLPEGCRHFTFIAVWKRNHTAGSQVIFEQSSPGQGRRACLLATGGGTRSQEAADGVLRLRVPAAIIDPAAWHDIVARFRGPNLELFVDGVLVDEDWPHGALDQFRAPFLIGAGYENGNLKTGFHGDIERVALWNRAVTNDEITALSGGPEEVARRELAINGPVQSSLQYWKPRGYNAWAGDCMPFFHDGTFHLFYLFDRRHHGSKWGQGAHQYAHFSTQDLVHWQPHPLAVPIAQQWECAMGTCDCLWHDGVYHMFYTDCGGRCEYLDKPQPGSWIFCATSTDGIHFHKDFQPLVTGGDCTVFQDPATGLFHMIRGGSNRLVSKDLRNWEETPGDFVVRKEGTSGECPHWFAWNGWYYFILGTNAIWKSRSALGPWEEMQPTIYDGLFVPKVAEFTGNRRILAGFLFAQGWGGHLAFRELIQYPDGSLGTKFPPEMVPAGGTPQPFQIETPGPSVERMPHGVTIRAAQAFTATMVKNMPKNSRITLRVVPQPGAGQFGLCFRARTGYEGGCELRFDPARKTAQYGVPENHGPAQDSAGRIAFGRDYAIENVTGLDRPFALDVIVKDDIVDTSIDNHRTMITRRYPEPEGDGLFFFARGGTVTFDQVEIRPLP
jgi:hypothetical protein